MDFVLNGVRYSLEADDVRSALRGGAPEDVREHWVEIDGVRWPPKQVFSLATGLDRSGFTSHTALRHVQRLGFPTSSWGTSSEPPASVDERQEPAAPEPDDRRSPDVILVGCTQSKAASARPAAELFTGARFTKARDLAERSGKPWYVLSAKFGLLAPDELIAPYDVYLGDQPREYREAWGRWVSAQLAALHELRGAVVEVHAGKTYCDPIAGPLAAAGATLRLPLAGLRQGEQLAWYTRLSDLPAAGSPAPPVSPVDEPDVSYLLDSTNAAAPQDFLALGRAASDVPGLYSWWIDESGAHKLSAGLGHGVAPGLIYAGRAGGQQSNGKISTNTLWGRIATMHLGGNRNFSTFRLTLAAVLTSAGLPMDDEAALTAWMHQHLRVATLPLTAERVFAAEQALLGRADPPLNLRDVEKTPLRRRLTELRSALNAR